MFIDQTRLHTKTVLTLDGPLKTFNSKEGPRQKFNIVFSDGYKAEFCPLVSETINLPKSGQDFCFKVRHRNEKGDEIEKATVEGAANPFKDGTPIITMNGHPATIALNAALKHAEINTAGKEGESRLSVSDVLADADMYLEWLFQKSNQ